MLECARKDPSRLYLGLDANHASLIEVSRQAAKSAAKGGAPNAMFVLGAAEALPGPLAGQVSSVSILFPWGSLLQAVLRPKPEFLERLGDLCRPDATIHVVTAIHGDADASEFARLGLEGRTLEQAAGGWREGGFDVSVDTLPAEHDCQTTWWRKIRQREGRVGTRLRAVPR